MKFYYIYTMYSRQSNLWLFIHFYYSQIMRTFTRSFYCFIIHIQTLYKYPKLNKVTNFCSSQSDFFLFLGIFFWLNIVKRSSYKMLNSWRKQKLSTSMKLNQQHCNLIWKLSFFSHLVTSSKLPPLTTLLHFSHFVLRNVTFQRQNVTQIACLWIKFW